MHRTLVGLGLPSLLFLGGCASLDLGRADVCLRKKLEITIPFSGGGEFIPRPCRSKEIFNKVFR